MTAPIATVREEAARLGAVRLADERRGFAGVIVDVRAPPPSPGGIASEELERRLLEMGFVEGARIEILHEGFIGRDPICVKLDDMRVALRRQDARGILVEPGAAASISPVRARP